ncbi:MAG TPA: ABC transporter ATP-binding protein [Gemmatimonadaceae bacterium]|nr:ABC transporter ATP-binding protein [Gemmatimonadaceae bacterium]
MASLSLTRMLTVRGLSKRFGPVWALRDASFHVNEGEVLGLIGPNGAGKSTVFQCLAGLLPSDGGEVLSGQRELEPGKRSSVMLFLPDRITPWPDQTVDFVLDFAAHAFGAAQSWAGSARGETGQVLRLHELSGKRMGQLSKGQRKRVLLAMALCAPQPLTLMDEPFDGLDLRHARVVAEYLRAQSRTGRTLFLSIHDMHDAARVCDRLVLLNEGTVVAEGTPDELRVRAQKPGGDFEEVFLALT